MCDRCPDLTKAEQRDNSLRSHALALSVLRETRAKVAEMTEKVKNDGN